MPEPLLKPEGESLNLLAITRAKAKMYEFDIPNEFHIRIEKNLESLFPLAISILGDISGQVNRGEYQPSEEKTIRFAAFYFDAFANSRLAPEVRDYVTLLAASGYYLCDLPGSAAVLSRQLVLESLPFTENGLEDAVASAIQGKYSFPEKAAETPYRVHAHEAFKEFERFSKTGEQAELYEKLTILRNTAYTYGSPDQMFFADVLCAIIRRRISRSVWSTLPGFSGQTVEKWIETFKKAHFPKELWPSQMLLGEKGVLAGASAIAQMPTSAGKTRAIELIIRSKFLAMANCVAVIVAPFRALCHEISGSMEQAFAGEDVLVDELSDIFQDELSETNTGTGHTILVVTPEKLLYVIRQNPVLTESIGLLVYDEGHQFETGIRGVTFELLLASLRDAIKPETQTVLISAVIAGAQQVAQWLFKEKGIVVSGENLTATYRSTSFVTWKTQRGQLEYVGNNPNNIEYFVPRVIEALPLALIGRERRPRIFPQKNDANSVALYLALKLAPKGTVALFCGTKTSAIGFSNRIIDHYNRSLSIPPPSSVADETELRRLVYQHEVNLGTAAAVTGAVRLGVVSHHAQIPFGIRLAIEHSLRKDFVRVVICTSTLAQGVNMPIRYLIFSGIYQAGEVMARRDFQNLIGRAGRAGMHTEGSIIFAAHDVYDNKANHRWQWRQISNLLTPGLSDKCESSISQLFGPIIDRTRATIREVDLREFTLGHVGANGFLDELRAQLLEHSKQNSVPYEFFEVQILAKLSVLAAIESFLMAHWTEENQNSDVLAESTLAYALANDSQKQALKDAFEVLCENIGKTVPDATRRQAFSRTLFGVGDNRYIEKWVTENLASLIECQSDEDALLKAWSLFTEKIEDSNFSRMTPDNRFWLAQCWIGGYSFGSIFTELERVGTRLGAGTHARHISLHQVVEMCESTIGYKGTLVAGAIRESIKLAGLGDSEIYNRFERLQKRLKYGLANDLQALIYEVGFKDRYLAKQLSGVANLQKCTSKKRLRFTMKGDEEVAAIISNFPSFFQERFDEL